MLIVQRHHAISEMGQYPARPGTDVIDLIVASLPLKQGFIADVPFFIYERGGRVPMTVAARAMAAFAKRGQREVWVIPLL